MTHDDDRRAFERAEADYLTEPAWRTGEGCEGECDACGCAVPGDMRLCDDCAADEALTSIDGSVAEHPTGDDDSD